MKKYKGEIIAALVGVLLFVLINGLVRSCDFEVVEDGRPSGITIERVE